MRQHPRPPHQQTHCRWSTSLFLPEGDQPSVTENDMDRCPHGLAWLSEGTSKSLLRDLLRQIDGPAVDEDLPAFLELLDRVVNIALDGLRTGCVQRLELNDVPVVA